MHLTVGNVLRTLIHSDPPRTLTDTKMAIDRALAPTASHAIRTNLSQVTRFSPGAFACHRDMLLDASLVVHLLQLDCQSARRTQKINLPTNQKGYDTFETTVGKISARRIQIFPDYFCLGVILKVILNNFQNNA